MKTLHTIYTNFAKRILIAIALITMSVGNAWGTSYISYNDNVQDASTTISSSNVNNGSAGAISWTGADCNYSDKRVNIAANGSITFTVSGDNEITKIVVTSGSSTEYYGTWTSTSGSVSSTSGVTTISGINSNSVTITTSTAFRCTSASTIKIYYTQDTGGGVVNCNGTYDFTKIDGLNTWGTSYSKRTVEYLDATVTFSEASKQTGTITDQPVTKGNDVSLVMTDGSTLSSVTWVCQQWSDKSQTITLHYSTNGGQSYTTTGVTSSNFTISSNNLPVGTNAVKITFSSSKNQVGITSCTIEKVCGPTETTITFDSNGGEGGPSPVTATKDKEMPSIASSLPSRTGHTLKGYYDAESEGTKYYNADGTSAKVWDKDDAEYTLYAQWTANQHSLTWDLNGGTVTTAGTNADVNATGTPSGNVAYGTSIQAPQVAKTGYTFNGWSPEFTVGTTMPDDDLTYTAQWTANRYTVKFDPNGGTGTKMVDQTFTYGVSQTLSINTYTKSGHNFAGWATSENGSVEYTDGASVNNLTASDNSIVTLYAQWTPKSLTNYRTLCDYEITWLIGEDPYEEGEPTTTVKAGQTISSLPTKPSDSALGCCSDAFMGWTTSEAKVIENEYLYETLGEIQEKFPSIYENLTFRAVFATSAQGVGTSIADFSEMGYENATAVTDQIVLGDGEGHGDATITLAKAPSSKNDAKYYDDGEAVRVYAGSTITISSTYDGATIKSVTFEFSASDTEGDNTISVTSGDGTYSEGTWTGDATAVTFTIGGSTGHRRIASITVTTGVAGSQYTNYVTSCDKMNDPSLGAVQLTYNSGDAIAVNCGNLSSKNSAASITFPNAVNLTCPITVTAPAGFVLATNRQSDTYTQTVVIKPIKTGENKGKITKTVYVRADAPENSETDYSSNITITGEEITETTVTVKADVTCKTYIFKTLTHIGDEHTSNTYYAGQIIEEAPKEPKKDDCSTKYTFDGWSESAVEYGSLVYNQVTFPFTMPAENVTLYPVYRVNTTEDYHRVTSDIGANNWAGDYLIAYSDQIFADGRFGGTGDAAIGKANVQAEDFSTAIVNDVVPADPYGNRYHVTLESVEGGYVLKTQDGKYNYYTTNSSNDISVSDNQSTAAKYALNVVFESKDDIRLSLSGNAAGSVFRYGCGQSGCFFRFYNDCGGKPIYLYKKSPLYTTPLICGTIEAADAVVTSTAGQTIKVNVPVTLTSDLTRPNTIEKAVSDNPNFSVTALENAGQHTIAIGYTPTATTDGTETANITLTASNNATTTFQVTGRHLPENFVIATKVGATWYALPADMSAATNPEGVLIEVDETNMTATAPLTTAYTLFPVKTTNTQYDRFALYGDRVRFSAVNNAHKGLWATSNGTTINNGAQIQSASDGGTTENTNPSYEWKITTTISNGNWQYTLQTEQQNNTNNLRYWTAATGAPKWGTYASGNDKLYFLPVTETKPFDYKVVEWYPTKVLIQTDAAITNPIVKIGGILVDHVTCTNKGGKLYEISGLPLVNNPTKVLTLSYTADEVTYTNSKGVPIILSRETKSISGEPFVALTKEVYNYADLVVRDGATLTMDGTQEANTLWDVTIYPTSKISVPESKKLTVHSLTLFGGIDEIYNGSTYTLNKYGVPELSLKGTLKKSISTIDYLMRVDSKQMYSLTVPYDVQLADIKYWDGTNIVLGDELWVSAYDGASRAQNQGNGKNWIYETDFASKLGAATLKAGVGYTISAELQSGVGASYSILRLPMTSNLANEASETAKQVAVTAHGIDAQVSDNHKGWNLVGNPYMTSIKGADDDDLVLGYLQETGTGPWEWVEKTYRYVTIPSDNGEWYYQQKFTEATLPPFKNFFVQIGTTGTLSFDLTTRQNAPARYLQQEQAPREVEFELLLSNEAQSDNMGLLISEEYTPAYEINADLEKMIGNMSVYSIYNGYQLAYNALSPLNAMEEIPLGYVLPSTGEYTFELNERGDFDEIEHIYLLDHDMNITTDLMEDIYTFAATEKKSDKRFAISVVLKAEEEVETPTQLETLEWESDRPCKFIYQDKMYILRNGVIYDAMGKQVQTINK